MFYGLIMKRKLPNPPRALQDATILDDVLDSIVRAVDRVLERQQKKQPVRTEEFEPAELRSA